MLVDALEFPDGHAFDCDVCIIGGGAAGMTIARELRGHPAKVVLLESGALESEPRSQALYDGTQQGELTPPQSSYTSVTRLRFLGGTTNHWDGWCKPLDAIDFEKRSWVAHSGWPLTRADLDPYYVRAAEVLDIEPFETVVHGRPRAPLLFPVGARVETRLFHVSPPTRFINYREQVSSAPNVDLVLHANVVDLVLAPSGRGLESVTIACLGGKRMTLRARHFVLATGGIENARLLLASNRVNPRGVGNDRDLVGRYFTDHPAVEELGQAVLPDHGALMALYFGAKDRVFKHQIVGVLQLAEEVQRKLALLNALFVLRKVPQWHRAPLSDDVAYLASAIDLPRRPEPLPEGAGTGIVKFGVAAEPVPNPASRVTLSAERDELGMPRIALDWQIDKTTVASACASLKEIGRELGLRAVGRLHYRYPEDGHWHGGTWSHHHMGTTRMSADPGGGVVDADAQVHGVANLFVAGSSIFPTVGCANPTYTIVALAVRLADHLKRRLGA